MLKKIAIGISIFIVLIIVAVVIVIQRGHSALEARKQEWLDIGGVLDPAKLTPRPVPDEENAAVAYEPLFDYLKSLSEEELNMLGDQDVADDPQFAAFVARHADAIESLRRISHMQKCQWDIKFEMGADTSLPHLSPARDAAKLLAAHARWAAQNGDYEIAVRDIEALLRMANHIDADPSLIAKLVVVAIREIGCRAYEDLFRDRTAPENEIPSILKDANDRAALKEALIAEVAVLGSHVNRVVDQQIGSRGGATARSMLVSWDRAYYFKVMIDAVEGTEKPYYEAPIEIEKPPVYALTARLLLPALDKGALSLAKGQLTVDLLLTAERLREYKVEHGSYPVPGALELPIDPVMGKRIAYERVDEGFVLRSEAKRNNGQRITWEWSK